VTGNATNYRNSQRTILYVQAKMKFRSPPSHFHHEPPLSDTLRNRKGRLKRTSGINVFDVHSGNILEVLLATPVFIQKYWFWTKNDCQVQNKEIKGNFSATKCKQNFDFEQLFRTLSKYSLNIVLFLQYQTVLKTCCESQLCSERACHLKAILNFKKCM